MDKHHFFELYPVESNANQLNPEAIPFPSKMITGYSILLILTLIALFFAFLSIFKVQRLFKWSEPTLALSTIYIALSLTFLVALNSINIALCEIEFIE